MKKLLTILLAFSMAFSSTPAIAFAATPAVMEEASVESEVKYVSMNVPYTDFYAAYNLTDAAVWDVNGEGLDAVSTATTSKFLGTDGLANGTYNDGTYILGVTLPVAVKAEDYDKLDATAEGNYAFTDLEEAPAAYSELTVNEDGSYSFSAMQAYTGDTTGLSVAESANGFTTAGYGDYQIDLEGVGTNNTLANGESYKVMYGAILYTDNGKALGMTALENMWFGTRVNNVEIAWSIPEGQGLQRAHGSGGAFYQFADINGQKLTKVDLITAVGVISIPCDITMTKYYTGEDKDVTVSAKDEQTLTVSYPAALEDVTVSVTYKAGRATTTLADKVTPADGNVALSAAMNELETSYTVTVYSSNYAPISVTFTHGTPALEYYKAQLTEKKDEAAALVEKNPALTTLAAHVTEAEELLANADATTAQVQELISELDELIEEATQKYITMNVPYSDFYAAYNLTDAAIWDVNGEGLDAVSTATTSKFLGTDGLANGTYNDGTYILGVTIPVAVKAKDYEKLDATLTAGNYAFTDLEEVPAAYSELTINKDGSYSFSAMQAYTGDTTGLSVAESANGFTSAGYGDYQIDLEGVGTDNTLANGESYKAMYGAILYTDNGKALGMTALENMWFGTRVTNVEIAWSIPEGQGLQRAHGSGGAFYQFADINGQKLTKVDIITAVGVISIPCDITMTEYYTGEDKDVTASVKDNQTLNVSYPAALEDVTVSVTYKAGRATTTLADKVTPVDGTVALDAALNVLETSYTVTVYSSNYAPISTTFTYGKKNQGTGKVQKFTYWVTVDAERNEEGAITSIKYSDDTTIGDQNAAYAEMAMEGIQEQITAKGSITSVNDIDVVSGATLSSNGIKAAIADMNGEEFDLTAANGSLVTGKNGELGLADSIKKAENFLKISALEKDDDGNYIIEGKSEAWMTLYDLYTQAVEMKAANDLKENYEEGLEEGLLEAKIDVAIAAVKAESGSEGGHGGGQTEQAGDTTNLQAAVDSAKALKEADYTAASWKLMQDELSEAESLIATGKASQTALDAQQADLETAVSSLVKKSAATIKASNHTVKASTSVRTIKLSASVNSKGTLTYSSNNKKITVDKNGNVKVAAYYAGKATITIKAAATATYKAATKTVTITVTKVNKAQSMTVKASKKTLKVNKKKAQTVKLTVKYAKGTVTYKSSSSKVKVSTKGTVTIPKKYKGTFKITVKAAGNGVYKACTKTVTIKVK